MKLKPRDRSEVYDRLYRLAQRILNKASCCSTCPIDCGRKATRSDGWGSSRSWCCRGCPHLGEHGCTVQALGCSLWLCGSKASNRDKVATRLGKLRDIAQHYKIHMARASKEESLKWGHKKDMWFVYHGSEALKLSGNGPSDNWDVVRF